MIGAVEAVDATERVARVSWQEHKEFVTFVDDGRVTCLLEDGLTQQITESPESLGVHEHPVYDLRRLPTGRPFQAGDFVMIRWTMLTKIAEAHSDSCKCCPCVMVLQGQSLDEIDWLGHIMERSKDGKFLVRFGAMEKVRDRLLPLETLSFALNLKDYELELADAEHEECDPEESNLEDSSQDVEMGDDHHEDSNGGLHSSDIISDENETKESPIAIIPSGIHATTDDESTKDTARSDAPTTARDDDRAALVSEISTEIDDAGMQIDSHSLQKHESCSTNGPESCILLEGAPADDHAYLDYAADMNPRRMKRIMKEHAILEKSLPSGIFVRSWESRLDLFRVLILGPDGTPYEHCPFLFDIILDKNFPQEPPTAYFHHASDANDQINPNLYLDGNICLSLLNT